MLLSNAAAFRLGAVEPAAVMFGAIEVYAPSLAASPPELAASTSGQSSGTEATITLPAREAGDYLTLIVASNHAPTLAFPAGVDSATPLVSAEGRLQALRVTPTAGATQITMSSTVSAFLTWWCGSWRNVDPDATVPAAANLPGNNTTAAIESPTVDLGRSATGYEVYVRAASVNATATWSTAPSNIFATTTGNAALAIRSDTVPEGATTLPAATAFDRGNDGVTRLESSLVFVLPPGTAAAPVAAFDSTVFDPAVFNA